MFWSYWAFRQPFTWNYDWYHFIKLLNDWGTSINPQSLLHRVARIEKPPSMHGIHLSACFGCVHEQSWGKGRTKSLEAHEHDQQFGENESTDIGKSQRLWKEGNSRINKVSAMGQGLAKIIAKVWISRNLKSSESDLHIAANACCINYPDTWL